MAVPLNHELCQVVQSKLPASSRDLLLQNKSTQDVGHLNVQQVRGVQSLGFKARAMMRSARSVCSKISKTADASTTINDCRSNASERELA